MGDSTLLEAMLVRCSTKELQVSPAALGDLRLASLLAGTEVVRQMDARATGFLRTVCQPAPIDDPRASLLPSESGGLSAFDEACTPFEAEVSEALTAAEILHSRAAVAGGGIFRWVERLPSAGITLAIPRRSRRAD